MGKTLAMIMQSSELFLGDVKAIFCIPIVFFILEVTFIFFWL